MARSGMARNVQRRGDVAKRRRIRWKPVGACPAIPTTRTAATSKRRSTAWSSDALPSERQSAAGAEVRVQTQVVPAAERARADAVLLRQAGRAVWRLQRRADGFRHLRSRRAGKKTRCCNRKRATRTSGCSRKAGSTRCASAIRRSASTRSGISSAITTTQCRAAHRSPASERDARAPPGRLQRALVGAW